MDILKIDDAIKAHSDWKLKLQRYLRDPDGSLNPDLIRDCHRCDLGKWIDLSNNSLINSFTEKNALIEEHRKFHKAAADIVERKNKGEDVTEEISLGSNSEFAKTSMNVVSLLMALKRHMAA